MGCSLYAKKERTPQDTSTEGERKKRASRGQEGARCIEANEKRSLMRGFSGARAPSSAKKHGAALQLELSARGNRARAKEAGEIISRAAPPS